MKKQGRKKTGRGFWEKEYGEKGRKHLALSANPSEDLVKFTRWLKREHGRAYLNPASSVLDLGCGNGRNLIHLSRSFGIHGTGYDISSEAVAQAKSASTGLPLAYEARSIEGTIPLPDHSQTIVLDMMTSHFLNAEERAFLLIEIERILKENGWFFFKTFLLDEDTHAKRLLREHPAPEAGSYIHPKIGVAEHVYTEQEICEALEKHFIIHKVSKSHRHLAGRGGAVLKRRSISIYAQKK